MPPFVKYILIITSVTLALIFLIIFVPVHKAAKTIDSLNNSIPRITSIMRYNGDTLDYECYPVPIDSISPHLIRAVIISEDIAFFWHHGIDWAELKIVIRQDITRKGFYRGGSTITMQLARLLFLSPRKTALRKVEEILIAKTLERKLSKRRILELYLNLVEWGPHIYGAQAASMHYFGIPASRLTRKQACALAAVLPSPKRWNPINPSKGVEKRIQIIYERLLKYEQKFPEKLWKTM